MAIPKKRIETSKNIVIIILILFGLSMVASYVLPILFEYIKDTAQQIFNTTSTLAGSILIGYFGKAGFENYDKNRKLLNKEEQEEGNG